MLDDAIQTPATPEAEAPEAPVVDGTASLTDAIAGAATGFESDQTLEDREDFDPTNLTEPSSDDDEPADKAQPPSDDTAEDKKEEPKAEGEDSSDADAPTDADSHTVDMQVVREGQENDVIKLSGLPQETADAMKHHFKQSARVPGLEAQLAQNQQDSATIEFMQQNPEDAMHWMEQAQPDAGAAFVRSWMARYSEEAINIVADLRLTEMDPETMKTRSELERLRTENRIRDSQVKFDHTAKQRDFSAQAVTVIQQLATALNLDPQTVNAEVFVRMASEKLGKMNPTATTKDMTFALQDLARETAAALNREPQTVVVGSSKDETPPDEGQPRDDVSGQFKKKVDTQEKHRKLAGGRTTVTPISAIKQRGVGTIEEAIERFRR